MKRDGTERGHHQRSLVARPLREPPAPAPPNPFEWKRASDSTDSWRCTSDKNVKRRNKSRASQQEQLRFSDAFGRRDRRLTLVARVHSASLLGQPPLRLLTPLPVHIFSSPPPPPRPPPSRLLEVRSDPVPADLLGLHNAALLVARSPRGPPASSLLGPYLLALVRNPAAHPGHVEHAARFRCRGILRLQPHPEPDQILKLVHLLLRELLKPYDLGDAGGLPPAEPHDDREELWERNL
mmetsp:Transcript_71080/g.201679  ORF Transcript_71080/g.201679 Transcript_71080/m.201679 type:complete len:238 (+) Transcript_71080:211-924(+)